MSGDGRILGLVPARGGSRGIPRKALAPLAGRPLIAWTLDAARRSGVLDRVVVTTDDAEIAEAARRWGGEVPFLRPAELAQDATAAIEPTLHALEALAASGYQPDWLMLLQPTSPLRSPEDIRAAAALAARPDVHSVMSVCEAVPPPQWMRRITPEGWLEDIIPREPATRRQDLAPAYALNGAIYLVRVAVLRRRRSFSGERTHAFVMPRERSVDVDTPWDLRLAEAILAAGTGAL